MKRFLLLLLLLSATSSASASFAQGRVQSGPVGVAMSETEREEWQRIKQRFKEHWPRMSGWTWALIHSYASKTEVEDALRLFEAIAITISNKNPTALRKFNGEHGFKERLTRLLAANDQTVSGFAANLLAVVGDPNYAPQIAALLDRAPVDGRQTTVRGQAAVALGLLNAKQYAARISLLLKSEHFYDRSGAAMALGQLKATEYSHDIARLLQDETVFSSVDTSPIYALFEMGVAENYKKEFAQVLDKQILDDKAVAAAYALARLRATEHSKDVAKLLKNDYRKGEAAKALALLGAKEYIAEISLLLEDPNSFNREDGAIALGMLGAKDHIPAIAKLLKDEKFWVQLGAAFALVLLEANEYSKSTLRTIAQQKRGPYFDAEDFSPLLITEANELEIRFKALLTRMRDHARKPGSKPGLLSPARRRS